MVFLAQTDTTAGFLSSDSIRINRVKGSPVSKAILREYSSFRLLLLTKRVPVRFKRVIRNSKRTTYILPCGLSFRVVFDSAHLRFLGCFDYLYSSSANLSGTGFDLKFALDNSDVWVVDSRGVYEDVCSRIYKVGYSRMRKVR